MNHYKVYNGYTAEDSCYQDVYAKSEEEAKEQAVELFKEEDKLSENKYCVGPDYWDKNNFKVYLGYEGLVCCKCKGEDQ
jgi:hypothetical protein